MSGGKKDDFDPLRWIEGDDPKPPSVEPVEPVDSEPTPAEAVPVARYRPPRNPSSSGDMSALMWLGAFVVAAVTALMIGMAVVPDSGPVAPASPVGITYEQYRRVREGMTYKEVVSIAGPPTQEMGSSRFGKVLTKMYYWKSAGYGNANMTFQDGELVSKAQFGLK